MIDKDALLMMCFPKPEDPLLTRKEIEMIMENNISFDETYRRGVHESWGGRAAVVYDILYRIINTHANLQKKDKANRH